MYACVYYMCIYVFMCFCVHVHVYFSFTSPAYQFVLLPPVEAAIRQLHNTVGNADTDGYTIVHGVGATNVLYMTITALSKSIIDVSVVCMYVCLCIYVCASYCISNTS